MDRGTPKSYYSSQKTKFTLTGTPIYFDPDVQLQKEYLQKLKSQRIKAQKLYNQYKSLLKQKQLLKTQKNELEDQLQLLTHKHQQNIEEHKLEIVKLQFRIEHLESQNQVLRDQHTLFNSTKAGYQKKLNELERQIEVYEQERFSRGDMIQYLEEEISRLERENQQISEECDQERMALKEKLAKSETANHKLQKQLGLQKQSNLKAKANWDRQRQKFSQNMALRLEQTKKIKADYQSQLNDKDRLYQIVVSELQESKMYWSVKIDEKNKEIHGYRKNIEHLKEEGKKWRVEVELLRDRTREKEQFQSKVVAISDCLKETLDQLTHKLSHKQSQYAQLSNTHLSTMTEFHTLQLKIQELEHALKVAKDTGRRLQQNCEEYLKIIEKMELTEQKRMVLVETQYEEIDRIERIFSQLQQ